MQLDIIYNEDYLEGMKGGHRNGRLDLGKDLFRSSHKIC